MKAFKVGLVLGVAALIIGCQGQNPFQRESNPTKNYDDVKSAANRPYLPPAQNVAAPAAQAPDLCLQPFRVSVENDQGSKLLTFTEGKESTYLIDVRGNLDPNFSIQADLPKDANFFPVSGNANLKVFRLTWKPSHVQTGVKVQTLQLHYIPATDPERCGGQIKESLNLIVQKTEIDPSISFKGTPQGKITFGDSFKFTIEINDPTSTKESAPNLTKISFEESAKRPETSPNFVLDATKAVDCEQKGKPAGDTKWQFTCAFNTKNIAGVESFLNKDKSVNVAFFATAQGAGAGRSSLPTPLALKIDFPIVPAAAAATAPTSHSAPTKTGPNGVPK